jgi:hypothetical protein
MSFLARAILAANDLISGVADVLAGKNGSGRRSMPALGEFRT